MKISIVTATYNSYPAIINCVASLIEQQNIQLEHLIIDGGSSDKTLEYIRSSPLKSMVISEPDGGIYDALNKGIKRATGEIIGFVHSDDLLASPIILEEIARIFKEKNVDGVYGDLFYVNKENTNRVIRNWKGKAFKRSNLKFGWMPAHPTLFLRKEVYQKHGFFDLNYKIAGDYDFMLRILKDPVMKFEYLPQTITKMRLGGASNKSLKNIIQKTKEDWQALRKNKVGGFYTLIFKNLRKVGQFILKS